MHPRMLTLFALVLALSAPAFAQEHPEHAAPAKAKSATLMTGYGNWHHPVSTKNAQAQAFFDQGLRLIYAFNHDEAARSFQRAAERDPKLAMAYWGIAEAVGPNYNDPASEDRFVQAHAAIAKAQTLAADASESDKEYIAALAKRFPTDPKSDLQAAAEQYRDAMRDVVKRFPDDLDAATLFAEAGMNLHPWGLWRADGTPEQGTEEIVATLESVIRREPNHLGAIHYYIHSVEASTSPERALAGANRLAQLAPAAGHIVHMPAHIYIRTGDYQAAVETNQKAALADQAYLKASGAEGIYSMMYYSHNLHFIAMAAAMNGNYLESRRGAQMLAANVSPHVKVMPPLEGFMTVPLAVEVRFHKWNEILKAPQPDPDMHTATVFWHFARGLALAGTGKLKEAEAEHKLVAEAEEKTPPDAVFQMPINNKTKDILKIAENVLGAKISLAKNDMDATVNQLRAAVAVQDSLKYDEPQDWFYPVRESLGAVLLKIGDDAGAEDVFRADLDRNPRNPRSLFGLEQALKALDRTYDAGFVRQQFDANWKGATRPTVDDLV
ncbi:MAG: Tetratricopeptide repeat protein [Candidatus Acidoferrum typicum]|nr:Tetratricopeptide repeat protein [Candidatus Acidoferrum typicum]